MLSVFFYFSRLKIFNKTKKRFEITGVAMSIYLHFLSLVISYFVTTGYVCDLASAKLWLFVTANLAYIIISCPYTGECQTGFFAYADVIAQWNSGRWRLFARCCYKFLIHLSSARLRLCKSIINSRFGGLRAGNVFRTPPVQINILRHVPVIFVKISSYSC